MSYAPRPAAWLSILRQRCPRCRNGAMFRGSIFRGLPDMYERCPVCSLKFAREAGYFLGAMYISYGLGIVCIAVVTLLLWLSTGLSLLKAVLGGVILFLPLAIPLTLLARVLWVYLDQAVDPETIYRAVE
jgi:uncharacterized protein (DUF983 family)